MRYLKRFASYSIVGTSTFALDLSLLYLAIDIFHIHYLLAAPGCFLIATSLNYRISRKYIFAETSRSIRDGYIIFIAIALLSALFITVCMYFFTEKLHWPYFISRVGIAALTGIWNYTLNFYYNFKVHKANKN